MAALASPKPAFVFEGVIARVHAPGDPLVYPEGNEFRDLAELQHLVKVAPGAPVTLTHPEEMLDAGGQAPIVGKLLSARLDGNRAIGTILVDSADGVSAIKGGIRELSLGYYSALDPARYQRRTRVDHLALVPRARCGAECAIRTDAADETARKDCGGDAGCPCASARTDEEIVSNQGVRRRIPCPGLKVETPRSDASDLHDARTVPDSAGNDLSKEHSMNLEQALAALTAANEKIGALTARADAADQALSTEKTRADQAAELAAKNEAAATTAKKDAEDLRAAEVTAAAKREADSVQAKKDADEAFDARVAARVAVLTAAATILPAADADGKAIDRSKMDEASIKREIVKHVDGIEIPADKHPAYIDAMYESATVRHAKGAESVAATRVALAAPKKDSATFAPTVDPERAADQANRDHIATAWQTPAKKGL